MTIAAGFVTNEGIVVSADSLYTTAGVKVFRPKLFPYDAQHCKVIFSCAGGAAFAESTIQRCIEKIDVSERSTVNSTNGLLGAIREVLNEEWPRLMQDNPNRLYGADFQLLMAIWSEVDGIGGLYSTTDTAIVRRDKYECIGAGLILGHYLIDSVFNPATGIRGAVVAGTHVVGKAKEYVDGCGGPTNILVLRSEGVIEGVSWLYIEPLERLLRAFDSNNGTLLMRLVTQPTIHFRDNLEYFGRTMVDLLKNDRWLDENDIFKYGPESLSEILSQWGLPEVK